MVSRVTCGTTPFRTMTSAARAGPANTLRKPCIRTLVCVRHLAPLQQSAAFYIQKQHIKAVLDLSYNKKKLGLVSKNERQGSGAFVQRTLGPQMMVLPSSLQEASRPGYLGFQETEFTTSA